MPSAEVSPGGIRKARLYFDIFARLSPTLRILITFEFTGEKVCKNSHGTFDSVIIDRITMISDEWWLTEVFMYYFRYSLAQCYA